MGAMEKVDERRAGSVTGGIRDPVRCPPDFQSSLLTDNLEPVSVRFQRFSKYKNFACGKGKS